MPLRNTYIRRSLTALLLIVFGIAITPKLYLHNLFASHIDLVSKQKDSSKEAISTSGYHCLCDDQVAESPFLGTLPPAEAILPIFYSSAGLLKVSCTSLPAYHTTLRGPPVML